MIFNVSFPLLTAPYVSRVLGANNLGLVNFSYSLVSFFLIFCNFGISIYGIKVISTSKNQTEININTTKLFVYSTLISLLVVPIYLVFSIYFFSGNTMYSLIIFSLVLFFSPFSFEWFFIGKENFRLVAIRSLIVRVFFLIAIFTFILDREDFLLYAFLLSASQIFTNITNFISAKNSWKFTPFKLNELKVLFLDLFPFFLTLFITSIFTIFDKILVGFFLDNYSVALYFRNRQITILIIGLTTALLKVLVPRLSNYFNIDFPNYFKLMKFSLSFLIFLTIPAAFGLVFLGREILFLLGGVEFVDGYSSFIIISIWTVFSSLNVFFDYQIAIPLGKEKITTKTTIYIATSIVFFSVILTPFYGLIGASLALLISEIIGFIFQYNYYNKHFENLKFFNSNFFTILFGSSSMFLILILSKSYFLVFLDLGWMMFFSIIIGIFSYILVLRFLGNEIINFLVSYVINYLSKKAKK